MSHLKVMAGGGWGDRYDTLMSIILIHTHEMLTTAQIS